MVDVLSTFIWQSTVVHSMDHAAYHKFVTNFLGGSCMSIRVPYEPFSNLKFWNDLETDMNIPLYKIKQNPERYLLSQSDLARTHTSMEVWVPYIPSLYNDTGSIRYVNYYFEKPDLVDAQNEFLSDLHSLNEDQKYQTDLSGRKE